MVPGATLPTSEGMDLRAIAILCGVTVGCGPVRDDRPAGPDAPPGEEIGERSGSRLQRRGYDLDGTQVFFNLYDAARGETCAIYSWSDGARYCTPIEHTGTVVFGDAACTAKLGLHYANTCTVAGPKYFGEYTIDTCGSALGALYTAGPASPAPAFYRATETGCIGPYDASDSEQLFALGAAVAPTELVAITRSQPAGTGRIQRVFDESADGLRIAPAVLRDTELATECFLSAENSTAWSCVPQAVQYAGQYADAACSQLITVSSRGCSPAPFAQHNEVRGCRYPRYAVYRTGQELDTDSGYENSSGTCTPQDYGEEARIHAVGERVELATGTRAAPGGDARIQKVRVSVEGDTFALPYSLYDTEKQAECAIGLATDGVERCLPYGAFAQRYFRDPGCTDPVTLFRFYRGAAGCEPAPPPVFGRNYLAPSDPCQSSQDMHLVGAEVTAPLYQNAGECQPVSSDQYAYYELGPIVPPAEFVAAVPITDR